MTYSYIPLDSNENVTVITGPLTSRIDAVSKYISYVGKAPAGSATSAAAWQIAYLVTDSSGNLTMTYANGSSAYDQIWDNRASLTYS